MLLTVTPNAAVDKTFLLERFEIDRVHRPVGFRAVAGGKGINVARVAHALGLPVMTTGFLGGHTGRFIAESLGEIGIPARFVETHGESRTCIAILDRSAHSQTEVNENGPEVTPGEVAALFDRFDALLSEGISRVALCGSLPPGCPETLYAEMIVRARRRGVPCALDASGPALRAGIDASPDVVKCNVLELQMVLGDGAALPVEPGALASAAAALLGRGTRCAAITLGAKGAIAVDESGAWFARPPAIDLVSAVGSGDAFLAAWIFAEGRGETTAGCLEWGVAAGAANAAVMGAGYCSRAQIERMRAVTRSGRNLEEPFGVPASGT